jgi:uncharacterized membrane protein
MTAAAALGCLVLVLALVELGFVVGLAAIKRPDAPAPSPEEMRAAFRWGGLFYVNPADPRGIVPKQVGWGWTLNFRSMTLLRIFVAIFALMMALTIAIIAR